MGSNRSCSMTFRVHTASGISPLFAARIMPRNGFKGYLFSSLNLFVFGDFFVGLWLCQRRGLPFCSGVVGLCRVPLWETLSFRQFFTFPVSLGFESTRTAHVLKISRSMGPLVTTDSHHHERCTCVDEGKCGSSYLLSFHNDALLVT